MIQFTELNETNRCAIKDYLEKADSHFCDLTAGNVYMWRNELKTLFAIEDGTLIIRKEIAPNRWSYLFPLGEHVDGAFEKIEEFALVHHERLSFYALDKEQNRFLKNRYRHHQSQSLRSWSDYLYLLSDLRDFPGKKYDSKRHNAKRFHVQNPKAVFRIASSADLPRLNQFLDQYLLENQNRDISLEEIGFTREMIRQFGCMESFLGYYEIEGRIIGFALGEKKGDCLYEHIEKAFREYEGIYQALTQDFLRTFGEGCLYVNREEDDGNEGLREAKLQLKPTAVLAKHYFEVTNQIDLIKDFPILEGERITLSLIEEQDAPFYAALALDEANNRYWGYDYQKDLPEGTKPTGGYFLQVVRNDFKARSFLTYIIKDKERNFLGEVVLYHFSSLNRAEVGIRLLPNAQRRGYAEEALRLLTDFCKNTIGLASLDYESYLANVSSLALASKLSFSETYRNDEKAYFHLLLSF